MMMVAISIVLHSMMRTKQTYMRIFFKTEDLLERHLIPYLFSNIGYLTFYIDCIQVEKITLKIS